MAKRRSGIQAASNTSDRPRRTYKYKGQTVICFAGGHFAAPEGSKVDPEHPINTVGYEDTKDDEILVMQSRKGHRPVTETWARIEVGAAEKVA